MKTDIQNYVTENEIVYLSVTILPPHTNCVATSPCEIRMFTITAELLTPTITTNLS